MGKDKGVNVLIYYWDERDGDDVCGWWFGPAVGGDQVWAYHPSRAALTPPPSEWNVPHDGAIDGKFRVSAPAAQVNTLASVQSAAASQPDKKSKKVESEK